jgi:hypothetical protein
MEGKNIHFTVFFVHFEALLDITYYSLEFSHLSPLLLTSYAGIRSKYAQESPKLTRY